MTKIPPKRGQLELPVLTPIAGMESPRSRDQTSSTSLEPISGWQPLEASAKDKAIFRSIADNYFRTKRK